MRTHGQDLRSLGTEVERCHRRLLAELPGVDRVALAVFDADGGTLRTFAHSTRGAEPLALYEAELNDVASLAALARERRDRVIDDLGVLPATGSEHARWLAASGYRSSFTRPVFEGDELLGFLFCDSEQPAYFTPPVLDRLTVHVELLSLLLSRALAPVKVLRSAVRLALEMSQLRDEETGAHLQRMSRYARIIAVGLAPHHGLTDEQVEYIFLFAPLHDVGKVGMPDRVLLKRGRLSDEETDLMHLHVIKGGEVVDTLLEQFGGGALPHSEMLRHIVLYHHEAPDGSGYVAGLRGDAIPLEARIVAVADVFDALTSERPYKPAWSPDTAMTYLWQGVPTRFDEECVAALAAASDRIEAVRTQFRDEREATA